MSSSDSDVTAPSIKFGSDSDSGSSDAPSQSKGKSTKSKTVVSDSDDEFEPKAPPPRQPVKKAAKKNPKKDAKKSAGKAQTKARAKAKSRGRRRNPRVAKAEEYKKSSLELAGQTGDNAFDAHLNGLAKAIAAEAVLARENQEVDSSQIKIKIPQAIFDELPVALPTIVVNDLIQRVNRFLVYRREMFDKEGNPKFKEDGSPETRQVFKYHARLEVFSEETNLLTLHVK